VLVLGLEGLGLGHGGCHAPWLVRPCTSLNVSPGQAMAWPAEHQKPRKHGVHSDAPARPVRSPTVPGAHAVGEAAPSAQ